MWRRRSVLDRPLAGLLTARAQRALDLAGQEAGALGHDLVTAGHLLVGLAGLGEGVAVMTLRSLGCDLTASAARGTDVGLDQVLERARREAAGLGHRYVGTEHLLLGLLHDETTAAALGVGLRQARDQVVKVLHGEAF
ncbi:Clp protease N-terminal domain-containing protein [Nonomuraea bangladeshensis]|uniref:Clp protease N-terminal domain-containing protein n=1 Tax=Nonomuraea bangladeshensis TaxID=404385 RepID=UPI003C2DF358